MPEVEALLRTISAIYAVPGDSSRWSEMVAKLEPLLGSAASAYMLVDAKNAQVDVAAYSGYSAASIQRYSGPEGMVKDIRFRFLDNLLPGQVFREFEYVPDRAGYDASEWIQYQLKEHGVYWCMTARVSKHRLWHDYISFNRREKLGPHTDEQKATLQALLPHLSRAAELHRTVSSLEYRFGAVLAVLDKFLVGLVILDAHGRIAVANAAARAACEASGRLRIGTDGRLRARDPKEDGALQVLIARTCGTASGRDDSDGGSVLLGSCGHRDRLLVEAMPLCDEGFSDGSGMRGTAVLIIDPANPCRLSADGLAKVFSLTASEREVADLLVNGASVHDIAEQRGNTVETVRSHLKNIRSKTGACSQLELLRMAAKVTPPIEGSAGHA
jgi:DNA-binding CsgD family transcriptional regulator